MNTTDTHNERIAKMTFSSVYPHYVAKAEKKGRTKAEVDEAIRWLTGYTQAALDAAIAAKTDYRTFFAEAPALNPARELVTGSVCGIKVQEVEDPLMKLIRILDKMIDEIAKGRPMAKVLRQPV